MVCHRGSGGIGIGHFAYLLGSHNLPHTSHSTLIYGAEPLPYLGCATKSAGRLALLYYCGYVQFCRGNAERGV